MCGRFKLTKKQQEVVDRYNAEVEQLFDELYNASPTQQLPVITDEEPGKIRLFRWGLVPSWAKDISIGNKLFNARAETLHEKPSFKIPLQRRRCLVPADGFYEWEKRLGGKKQPYVISLKNQEIFSFAGLWDVWKNPEGKVIHSFTIITTEPNSLMKNIHERMPVILKKEEETLWLDKNLSAEKALQMLKPYDPELMIAVPVEKVG
jgi:putative SOS response-associated peptidase YedK